MAATNLAQVAAVFNTTFASRYADQLRRDVFLLNVFETAAEQEGNKQCIQAVKLSGRDNADWDDGSDLHLTNDFDTTNARDFAALDWARIRSGVHLDGLVQALAATNPTRGLDQTLIREEMKDASNDLAKKLGTAFYTGNPTAGTRQLCGLNAICATGTFAGIDPTDPGRAEWASVDAADSLGNLTPRLLRDLLINPFREAAGEDPDFITCSSTMFSAIEDAIEDSPSYRECKSIQPSGMGATIDLTTIKGVRAIRLYDVPIVLDRFAPANSFYAVNLRGSTLKYVPPSWDPAFGDVVAGELGRITGEGVGPDQVEAIFRITQGRLSPHLRVMGTTGDNDRLLLLVYLQQQIKHRNHFGRLVLS